MLQTRRAADRGHAEHGWLSTFHTFSFASYYDPAFNGFRSLRVINEDRVAPGRGFKTHSHENMEIVTYVIDGALEHNDSTGQSAIIRKGEIQRMSAGTGVTHSELNRSAIDPVHFLQIWILPEKSGLAPGYGRFRYAEVCEPNNLCLITSKNGRHGSMTIHQDVDIYRGELDNGKGCTYRTTQGRRQWIQVVDGELSVNGTRLSAGDGCGLSAQNLLQITAKTGKNEFLLFDLA